MKKRKSSTDRAPSRRRRHPLTIPLILTWADDYYRRHGRWPNVKSGKVPSAGGATWTNIDDALRKGSRGLPGNSSLLKLLMRFRGALRGPEPLTLSKILQWAAGHRRQTGYWPNSRSGPVLAAAGENWKAINQALTTGSRGLAGGSSIVRLLSQRGLVRHLQYPRPRLTPRQVLGWADAFFRKHGYWPGARSGEVSGAPGEKWVNIDRALYTGQRGLPRAVSLKRFLEAAKGEKLYCGRSPLDPRQILAWADAFFRKHGRWPHGRSGPISGAGGLTWQRIDAALQKGSRGLHGGSSLRRFLEESKGVKLRGGRPALTIPRIQAWANAYFDGHGEWPHSGSGPVAEAPFESWRNIDVALITGFRGLPGGSSLARLFGRKRERDRRRPG